VANSAALIEPDGPMTVYRKAHLWDREKLIFTPAMHRRRWWKPPSDASR
jgi:predicted amidohydrolase